MCSAEFPHLHDVYCLLPSQNTSMTRVTIFGRLKFAACCRDQQQKPAFDAMPMVVYLLCVHFNERSDNQRGELMEPLLAVDKLAVWPTIAYKVVTDDDGQHECL